MPDREYMMIEIELDGKKVEVAAGSMVMNAAEKAGVYIPHFCYHKKLSIAASCRMCLVDVEKAPKPVPACATPVTQGMIVRTKSDKALKAQKDVMEFLLINHPLDCPVCDQGGECQLQDLAVGYGGTSSRYAEEKRVVPHKDVGPLISMEEMSRCIHCTRCVRFGQEIAGVMELGMINRGEHSEITTAEGITVDSELSGNMIDICPVGALTSKPFRYSARTWELSRRKSISPHDSTGANLIVQVKNHRVMRVVPFENEEVNECWIADRDRFSYEALNGTERLTKPMLKQGGKWEEVDWQTALEYVANGISQIQKENGKDSVGALVSPHSTLEELFLAGRLLRGLGTENIDWRTRNYQHPVQDGVRWLGLKIAELSSLDTVLVLGSNIRKEHPLFAQRIRQALKKGGVLFSVDSQTNDLAMPADSTVVGEENWLDYLTELAFVIANIQNIAPPIPNYAFKNKYELVHLANSLMAERPKKAILLGNRAAQHPYAEQILAIVQWIAQRSNVSFGYLTEAANTVGAQWMKVQPQAKTEFHALGLLRGSVKGLLLLNTEPVFDSVLGSDAISALNKMDMVVTLSPFKANMDFSDVLLPIAPFSETSGTFVNAEGRVQSFHAAVKPLGDTRPGWKVLRVLANILNIGDMNYETSQEVLRSAIGENINFVPEHVLNNKTDLPLENISIDLVRKPKNVGIYQLDSIVRRAPALQATADARPFSTMET